MAPGKPAAKVEIDTGKMLAEGVEIWAKGLGHAWANALRLWRIPLDFARPEDSRLGVCSTTVYFPAPKGDCDRDLRCVSVRDVVGGTTVAAKVDLTPATVPARAGKPTRVRLDVALPAGCAAGAFEVTIEDQTSGESQTYVVPLGVPGPGS